MDEHHGACGLQWRVRKQLERSSMLFSPHNQMCCVRGRCPCPCWPQAGPFDAAEMDLLNAVKTYMHVLFGEQLWPSIQARFLAVQPHRRAHVLSTLCKNSLYPEFDMTLLGWVREDQEKAQWVLNMGVCPNIAGAFVLPRPRVESTWRGWSGGPLHPGRPPQDKLRSPLVYDKCLVDLMLLSAGAYPKHASDQRRQWHRWHGRAARRLWAALK